MIFSRFKSVATITVVSFLSFAIPPLAAFEKVDFSHEIRAGLQEPIDVAVGSDGTTYVLDEKGCKVFMYDAAGYLVKEFGSCGRKPGQFSRPRSITYTLDNYLMVADTGNSRIQAFDPDGEFLFSFGRSGSLRGQFNRPSGVASDTLGTIYVADTSNNRIQIFSPHGVYRRDIILDSPPMDVAIDERNVLYILLPQEGVVQIHDNQRIYELSLEVSGKNYISSAVAISVDHRGDIYISENSEHSVKKFDRSQELLISFGSEGKGRGQFDEPRGLFADDEGYVYIADQDNQRLQVFEITESIKQPLITTGLVYQSYVDYINKISAQDEINDVRIDAEGTLYAVSARYHNLMVIDASKRVIGKSGREEGAFKSPMAVDVDREEGYVYVADTENCRVQVFDEEGNFIFQFGERGKKTGQFDSPQGIVVNNEDMIYVADTDNHRIQIFNKDGIFLKAFGSQSDNGRDELPSTGTFRFPTSLALDAQGQLYVVDRENHRIQIFDEHGNFVDAIGSFGDGYKEFNLPVDIALDDEGMMVVADAGNHRIQLIDPQTIDFPFMFGAPAEGPGQMSELMAVDILDNKIYVADASREAIRIYQIFEGKRKEKSVPVAPVEEVEEETQDEWEDEQEFELK